VSLSASAPGEPSSTFKRSLRAQVSKFDLTVSKSWASIPKDRTASHSPF
jgi:hypothetical protein